MGACVVGNVTQSGFSLMGMDACFEGVELIGVPQGALRAVSTIGLRNNCFFILELSDV